MANTPVAKILLVEDEENLRELVGGRLEANGYEVKTAVDGYDALSKAKQFLPDLIILDLMIPKMDGYTVCKMLKFSGFAETPIILFSARSSPEDVRRGLDMGANGYVTKPFEPEVLLGKIAELLAAKNAPPGTTPPPITPSPAELAAEQAKTADQARAAAAAVEAAKPPPPIPADAPDRPGPRPPKP